MTSFTNHKPKIAQPSSCQQGTLTTRSTATGGRGESFECLKHFTRHLQRQYSWAFCMLLLCTLGMSACTSISQNTEDSQEAEEGAAAALAPADRIGMYSAAPDMAIDPDNEYHAILKTEKGDMRIRLFTQDAPVTVNNFVFLARDGFYNDTHFHRVLENFMAQAGDPSGTGAGGPGYQFQDEIVATLQFDRAGLLAMANAGPNTNGSQFFITFAETPWLNGNHTIFGEVVEGMDVLFSLALRDPAAGASESPGELLITVEIEESE